MTTVSGIIVDVSNPIDPELQAAGDTRNVVDSYRNWHMQAIRDDMRARSGGLEVAIENLERDFNMGTIVRNANAFNARKVHVIGRRQWNKRGAMKTDAYLDVVYHASTQEFLQDIAGKTLVAVDNVGETTPLHRVDFPEECVLLMGSEKNGISDELLAAADIKVEIPQFGSTRSINVGVASGIVMYRWAEQHLLDRK